MKQEMMQKVWPLILGKVTNGIYVLTTSHKEKINGMVISWVSQVSYDPPLVMVAIHPNRYSHNLVKQSGCFALHVLARDQTELLGRFMGSEPAAKFDSIQWNKGESGCPIIGSCVAYMECEIRESLSPGNHTLFIGEVKNAQVLSDDEPLNTRDYLGLYLGKD